MFEDVIKKLDALIDAGNIVDLNAYVRELELDFNGRNLGDRTSLRLDKKTDARLRVFSKKENRTLNNSAAYLIAQKLKELEESEEIKRRLESNGVFDEFERFTSLKDLINVKE